MTRQEAIALVREVSNYMATRPEIDEAIDMAIDALEKEPKRGKWVDRASELDAGFRRHDFVCSECTRAANYFVGGSEDWWDMEKPKYCPNCGARMESEEE